MIFRLISFLVFWLFCTSVMANEENSNANLLITSAVKVSAHISIYSAELIASDTAKAELQRFRQGGSGQQPLVFSEDSVGLQELIHGSYYQELTNHLVDELAAWYDKKIPSNGGLFSQANTFKVFGFTDFMTEVVDGVDMADIIGTMTYYVRVHTQNGRIYFRAINKMSLESYSAENYFRHQLIENPQSGAFESTTQVFDWSVAIPNKYLEENSSSL